jgi:hypothetical protein
MTQIKQIKQILIKQILSKILKNVKFKIWILQKNFIRFNRFSYSIFYIFYYYMYVRFFF